MSNSDPLPAAVLRRKAVVYVRQSTQTQVQTNLESKRRQYDLVEEARRRGFAQVEVIDDDLGRSASGMVARPGFDRLVAWLCAGEVGAVLCFDASRLARNGRDWHHLLELCGLVEARVIDLDGVYDPCRPNDRLLLGMKGSISEFELGVLRARMFEAARAKAHRGELRISVPVGYVWHREIGLGFDPDMRLQEAIRLIFERFRKLGSARQVLLSLAADEVHFPRPSDGKKMVSFDWTPIRYRNVISVLKNPFYAGVYAYGKSEKRTTLVDGRLRKTYKHGKPLDRWDVMLKEHHEAYIDWAEFERNQKQLALNAYGKVDGAKSGRGGRALLAGMLGCGRCGRRLVVAYTGRGVPQAVYRCDRPNLQLAQPRCFTFGGRRPDEAVTRELLRAVEPMAIEAALQAERRHMEVQLDQRRIVELELQQARYEATLAERRYAACDPDNRLIAAQLEKSWEGALQRVLACEQRLNAVEQAQSSEPARLDRTCRRSRGRVGCAGRDDALAPAAAAHPRQGHRRRCRRCDPRGRADDPLARRTAFAGARHQATHRRARLPYAGRGAGRHAQHGGQVVRRAHRRDAQPHGPSHGSGQDVDRASRELRAHGQRHPCVPFGAQGRRVVDHVGGRCQARRQQPPHSPPHQGRIAACRAGSTACAVSDSGKRSAGSADHRRGRANRSPVSHR